MVKHNWTQEEIEFLTKNVPGRGYHELVELFYNWSKIKLSASQIRAFIKNRKLNTGRTGRFVKGHVPANKGTKGITIGGRETQFKKGNRPANYMPVGTERVNGDGYIDIKIADPNKWKAKHKIIWEKHNGDIPKGHAIIFGDRDRRNFDINNLILVTRRQLIELNRKNLIKSNIDGTKTGIIIADLMIKINKKLKGETA